MEIIQTILEWPIIIQGALGSALFWALLTGGQKLLVFASQKLSKDKEVANYFAKAFKATKIRDEQVLKTHAFRIAAYGALHYLIKAILVCVLSILMGQFVPLFQEIGLVFGCYFLFRALSYVPHFDSLPSDEKIREELELDKES
ncbi:hypothetical protein EBI01_18445 [Marinomonas rhizomae]|uniref:Uncharacterized protein n=1 Tax=Marinomonas rhizomae TaxID=491948 RepID=A0A366IVR5_9GAMM|nr:hypothetical protein [Marinomonas rhizomae]RBP78260.1 hypothetical protein DFP80_12148 [Marinomonas rhizomae]RNF69792.1 hypothetical protein EBI01_18445 [Marinomonas rhizomae]